MSGSDEYPAIHKSLMTIGTKTIDTKFPSVRLSPINRAPEGQPFYDTIAFLIFCPKHRNIAICQTFYSDRKYAVWLPFIYHHKDIGINLAIEDGLCLILSDYDSELLQKYKKEVPFDTNIYSIFEVYLPNANKAVTQVSCWARLHSDKPGFECCRNTSRIHWFNEDEEEECETIQDQYWGKGVKEFYILMKAKLNNLQVNHITIQGPGLYLAKDYYENGKTNTRENTLLRSSGITKKQIDLLFTDFYDQCFPYTSMNFGSFERYLCKYGIHETESKMHRLFNTFKSMKSLSPYTTWDYLTFENILLGLAYMDKDCPHNGGRLIFVFKYYDSNRKGFLSEDDFREMVTDILENEGQEVIDRIVAEGMTANESPDGMNWSEFYKRSQTTQLLNANRLVKSDQNYLKNICKDLKTRTTGPLDSLKRILKFKF